jgi:hypothetical protein
MKSRQDKDPTVTLNTQELEAKLDEIERTMGAETARPFRLLLGWVLRLQGMLDGKNVTITRLRKMIFGASTERTRHVEAQQDPNSIASAEMAVEEAKRSDASG